MKIGVSYSHHGKVQYFVYWSDIVPRKDDIISRAKDNKYGKIILRVRRVIHMVNEEDDLEYVKIAADEVSSGWYIQEVK